MSVRIMIFSKSMSMNLNRKREVVMGKIEITLATEDDIQEIGALYDALNDYLAEHENYPGWRKGIYPTDEDAATGVEVLRLDVTEKNVPAISLYEQYGFSYIDTVDLGLEEFGLKWFKLYEKLL